MERQDTGILLNDKNIKLHRAYFQQMTRLLGLNVLYRAPRENKSYNGYGELDTYYYNPIKVGVIYDEHPQQRTLKKMGWASQLADSSTIIHVPYDLEKLQVGSLFIIPSGLDNTEGRVFRVIKMQSIPIYPASITCELAPVWENTMPQNQAEEFKQSNFNLLDDESEEYEH